MIKLYLYTIFHANLQYSSIPEDHYSAVIDSCYWPVVSLLDKHKISLGLEFPAYTLEKVNEIDPTFLDALKHYRRGGRCEIIGSGYSQNIFPLIPAEVNLKNLLFGNEVYRDLLGEIPRVAYVNEQVYSRGLPELYLDAGYEAIVLDWHNSVMSSRFPADYQYQAVRLRGAGGERIKLIWNNSISFQRFQRFIRGEISLQEYLDYIMSHSSKEANRAFLLYGSDWEIFRPHGETDFPNGNSSEEIKRLDELFSSLESMAEIEVVAPSEVLELLPPVNEIEIGTAESPMPCRKQAKYNVTRWAVCGRKNARINTECFRAFHLLSNIEALMHWLDDNQAGADVASIKQKWLELCYLWGSDFRSFATEDKHLEFYNRIGFLLGDLDRVLTELSSNVQVLGDFALYNPHSTTWRDLPYEFSLQFLPGQHYDIPSITLDDKPLTTQVEEVYYYRDKSLRSARFVICPVLAPLSLSQGRLIQEAPIRNESEWELCDKSVKTAQVQVDFMSSRGGNIERLFFPNISRIHLAGTIPHDFYDEISFSTDQYTAHTIIQERDFKKTTDLCSATMSLPCADGNYPIRVPVKCKVSFPNVDLYKTYHLYVDQPRLDVRYTFRIADLSPYFLRTGILTVNPEAFDRKQLKYSTVNGGRSVESFSLNGARVKHIETVDARFSSSHCLGASEGWLDISDGQKGLAAITKKRELYSVPLLHYEETRKAFYLRIYNSLCETDETTRQHWRGYSKFESIYLGHRNETQEVRPKSQMIGGGLLLIKKKS